MCAAILVGTRSLGTKQATLFDAAQATAIVEEARTRQVVQPDAGMTLRRGSHTVVIEPDMRGSRTDVPREPGSYWEDRG
jgi:hypothetical protein